MRRHMRFDIRRLAPALAAAAALAAFGSTWAVYQGQSSLDNPVLTGHSGAAIVENYTPDSSLLPGETAVKQVAFTNTGKMDLFLRVEVKENTTEDGTEYLPDEEGWYEKSGSKLELDTAFVIKNWTDYWKPGTFDCEWSNPIEDGTTGKTYRYYQKILPKGETTNLILDSVRLNPEVSNDRHKEDYSDKIYRLTFRAEAVPVEELDGKPSVSDEWNVTVTADEDGNLTWNAR